jgi:antitoxin (DNA-binding transcriptional repressor) of toxin-antitoxin stability system
MQVVAIRELKNHLSEYVRLVRAGERLLITSHGEVVAELRAPSPKVPRMLLSAFRSWSAVGQHEGSSGTILRSTGRTNGLFQRPLLRSFWTGIETIGDRLRGVERCAFLAPR